jgi:hypothetical protein
MCGKASKMRRRQHIFAVHGRMMSPFTSTPNFASGELFRAFRIER